MGGAANGLALAAPYTAVDIDLEVLSTGFHPGDIIDLRLTVTNPTAGPLTVSARIPVGVLPHDDSVICEISQVELAGGASEVRECQYGLPLGLDCDPSLFGSVNVVGLIAVDSDRETLDVVGILVECPDPWRAVANATLDFGAGPFPLGSTVNPQIHVDNTGTATFGGVFVALGFDDGRPANVGVILCQGLPVALKPGEGLDVPCPFVLAPAGFDLNGTFVCDPVATTQVDGSWQDGELIVNAMKGVDVLDIAGLPSCDPQPAPTVPPTDAVEANPRPADGPMAGLALVTLIALALAGVSRSVASPPRLLKHGELPSGRLRRGE